MPSTSDIDAIGACRDPIRRNLRITQAYHELSIATAKAIGPGANWCTFATWASKQAGQTIRGDDLGRKIEAVFAESDTVQLIVARSRDLRRAIGRRVDSDVVLRAIRDACAPSLIVGRVADAVARGNKKVFDEIGRQFAGFVEVMAATGARPAVLEAFCDGLRPGDPPDGQRLLAEAFRTYHRARSGTTPKARAESMLLANLEIGVHEQTRLQPEILEALNACVPDPPALTRRLVDALFASSGHAVDRPARLSRSRTVAAHAYASVVEKLRARVRAVVTEELMTLALPGGVLRLGRDVTGPFPESLVTLTDPELVEFLKSVDPTRDTPLGSGTDDWADLFDRLHFIADLFRTRHDDPTLSVPPFSPDQLRAMAENRTPDGSL